MVLNKAFGERFKVRFESRGDARPSAQVYADRKRLLQVMTNLLSNAAKFSPEGDVVEITHRGARRQRARRACTTAAPAFPRPSAAASSAASPRPIPPPTRQKGGTGLGLAICKRLIEMMHGRIGFEDRPGGGTTFWFELPSDP